MMAFPWGKKGSRLERMRGPREWQKEELLNIASFIQENKERIKNGKSPGTYKCAISSGRGIGKSAFVAWLTLWQLSCQLGSSVIITANTDAQLTHRTFAEVGKWLTLSINSYWFERTQKSIMPTDWLRKEMASDLETDHQLYYAKGELWTEDNPDAFAGSHNDLGLMVLYDEASGIPVPIWTVTDGFFTEITPYRFWFALSNPRSNSGQFYDCFHEHARYWRSRKIDARSVEGGGEEQTHKEIIEKYGINSRQARVEVLGEFPEVGDQQFISRSEVERACKRDLSRLDDYAPLLIGVDIARYGDDRTVFFFRQGRDARSIPPIVMMGADNMTVANKLASVIDEYDPDGVMIDSGAGAGVIDRLKEMGYKRIHEVIFGSASGDDTWFDHRTEMWAQMRDWIPGGQLDGVSENGKRLVEELVGPEYEYIGREQRIKLEAKEKMKKRLPRLGSPDFADALAVTFHCHVARRDSKTSGSFQIPKRRIAQGVGSEVSFDGYKDSGTARKAKGVGCDIDFG